LVISSHRINTGVPSSFVCTRTRSGSLACLRSTTASPPCAFALIQSHRWGTAFPPISMRNASVQRDAYSFASISFSARTRPMGDQ